MPIKAIEERRAERERLIGVAREWAQRVAARLDVRSVVVAGSVARGDFNVWSDIDVVVVAERLPALLPERLALLGDDSPAGLQPFGFTVAELDRELRRRNALLEDALEHGVLVYGEPLTALAPSRSPG